MANGFTDVVFLVNALIYECIGDFWLVELQVVSVIVLNRLMLIMTIVLMNKLLYKFNAIYY